MHAALRPPSVLHCLLLSLTQSLSSLFLSSTKLPIHCPANQSLHSFSQSSMTRFIWPGPCPSNQPSPFFHLEEPVKSQIPIQRQIQSIEAPAYSIVPLHL